MIRILVGTLLLLPWQGMAQRSEVAVMGGMKSDGGWMGSLGYHLKLGPVQVGAVGEAAAANTNYVILGTTTTKNYTYYSVGANVAYLFKIPRGYVYPAFVFRQKLPATVSSDKYSGMQAGLQMGLTFKIYKSLYLNGETGFRYDVTGFETKGTTGAVSSATLSNIVIPVMLGIRVRL